MHVSRLVGIKIRAEYNIAHSFTNNRHRHRKRLWVEAPVVTIKHINIREDVFITVIYFEWKHFLEICDVFNIRGFVKFVPSF